MFKSGKARGNLGDEMLDTLGFSGRKTTKTQLLKDLENDVNFLNSGPRQIKVKNE